MQLCTTNPSFAWVVSEVDPGGSHAADEWSTCDSGTGSEGSTMRVEVGVKEECPGVAWMVLGMGHDGTTYAWGMVSCVI